MVSMDVAHALLIASFRDISKVFGTSTLHICDVYITAAALSYNSAA